MTAWTVDSGPWSTLKLCPMSGWTHVPGRLRRRRASLGRIVLALFALASFSAGAAPCFAMAPSIAPLHESHESHLAGAPNHDHAHAVGHEHGTPSGEIEHAPSPCPHCPLVAVLAGSVAGSHSFCSAADGASDGGKSVTTLPAYKCASSAAVVEVFPPDREPSPSSPRQPPTEVASPSIALNLRHCVFLI